MNPYAILTWTRSTARAVEPRGQRQAELLERSNVDHVANLRSSKQGAELVRDDLLDGIDAYQAMRRLFWPDLLGVLPKGEPENLGRVDCFLSTDRRRILDARGGGSRGRVSPWGQSSRRAIG